MSSLLHYQSLVSILVNSTSVDRRGAVIYSLFLFSTREHLWRPCFPGRILCGGPARDAQIGCVADHRCGGNRTENTNGGKLAIS